MTKRNTNITLDDVKCCKYGCILSYIVVIILENTICCCCKTSQKNIIPKNSY